MTTAYRIALCIAIACAIGLGIAQGYLQMRHMAEGPPVVVSYVPAKYEGMTDRLYLDRKGELVCCVEGDNE